MVLIGALTAGSKLEHQPDLQVIQRAVENEIVAGVVNIDQTVASHPSHSFAKVVSKCRSERPGEIAVDTAAGISLQHVFPFASAWLPYEPDIGIRKIDDEEFSLRTGLSGRQTVVSKVVNPLDRLTNVFGRQIQGAVAWRYYSFATIGYVSSIRYPAFPLEIGYGPTDRSYWNSGRLVKGGYATGPSFDIA